MNEFDAIDVIVEGMVISSRLFIDLIDCSCIEVTSVNVSFFKLLQEQKESEIIVFTDDGVENEVNLFPGG